MGAVYGSDGLLALISLGKLVIEPLDTKRVKENGIDLTLDKKVALLKNDCIFDFKASEHENEKCYEVVEFEDTILLPPHKNFLLVTREWVELNGPICAQVNLKSTIARAGIMAPPTIVDYGFKGQIVLEIFTPSFPVRIYEGMPFAHLIVCKLLDEGEKYDGNYQGQTGIRLPKTPLI